MPVESTVCVEVAGVDAMQRWLGRPGVCLAESHRVSGSDDTKIRVRDLGGSQRFVNGAEPPTDAASVVSVDIVDRASVPVTQDDRLLRFIDDGEELPAERFHQARAGPKRGLEAAARDGRSFVVLDKA